MVPPHPQRNKPSRFYLFASESFIEFPLWFLQPILKAREECSPHMWTATLHVSSRVAVQTPLASLPRQTKDLLLETRHSMVGFLLKCTSNLFSAVHFIDRQEEGGGGGEENGSEIEEEEDFKRKQNYLLEHTILKCEPEIIWISVVTVSLFKTMFKALDVAQW